MPLLFKVQCLLDEIETVDVLHFRLGTILVGADWTNRDVGVDPHRAFFHLNVRDPSKLNPLPQSFQVGHRFFWRGNVWLGDDFDQRRALPVQVHVRVVARVGVLAGIFFNVHFLDPDFFLLAINLNFNPAIMCDWRFGLGYLVGLRVVRIEVVLPVKVHVL